MITLADLYDVVSAVVPLYVTMFLAYGSVKYCKLFTPEQCSGINRFVAIFAIPLLSFEFISRINPYKMDLLFIAADVVWKCLVLVVSFLWAKFSRRGDLDWMITIFSLSTLPNTLVMGIPLLKSMYGDDKEDLMVQAVVLQCIVWYTLLLFLFEFRAAKILIENQNSATKTSTSSNGFERREERAEARKERDEEAAHEMVNGSKSPELSETEIVHTCNQAAPASQKLNLGEEHGKEVHLCLWRCGCCNSQGSCEQSMQVCCKEVENAGEMKQERNEKTVVTNAQETSPTSLDMIKSLMKMVWFKLVRNPNSYASLVGLGWALVSCRWGFKKPQILEKSVTILSSAGLGMAMFSLGLFMALQPRIIACGKKLTLYGMIARFVIGPAVMAMASLTVGLKGTILKLSIVQASLPQGIVPFVFAREYNVYPDVLSTAVIFGMIVSLPISILYYILLGL